MANNMISKDLGPATAYAIAVENGYTGTEEQWASEIANASNNAQTASQKASDAEAYAAGTRGGEAVDSDDPAYQNNAEYYSGEAADSAEAAAGSATSAAESAATASAAYNVNLLAPNYSSSNTYAVGDHVIYNGGYYECISAISTAEAWTAAHWRQVTVGAEAADLKSALSNETAIIETGKFSIDAFGVGNFDYGVYRPTERPYRIGSKFTFVLQFDIELDVESGYRYAISYISSGSWTNTGWLVSKYTVPAYTQFGVVIAKITEDTSSIADVATFVGNIVVKDDRFAKYGERITILETYDNILETGKFISDLFGVGETTNGIYYPTSRPYRCTTKGPLSFKFSSIDIEIADGYRIIVSKYSNGSWTASSWLTTPVSISAGEIFTILIAKVTEDTSSTADVNTFVGSLYIKTNIGEKFNEIDKSISVFRSISEERKMPDSIFGNGEFVNGAYLPSPSGRQYRIATISPMVLNYEVQLKAKTGFRFYICKYENSDWTNVGWKTDYIVPSNTPFGFQIARVTEDSSETANISVFNSNLEVYDKLNKEIQDSYHQDINKTAIETYMAKFYDSIDAESYIFFTDPHLMGTAGTFSEDTFNYYLNTLKCTADRISADYVVCGGDWLNSGDTKAEASEKLGYVDGRMREMFPDKYFPMAGNHDFNYLGVDGEGTRLTPQNWISPHSLRNYWFHDHLHSYYKFKKAYVQNYVLDTRTDYDGTEAYDKEMLDWFADNLIQDDPQHSTVMFHIYYLGAVGTTIPTRVKAIGAIISAFNSHSSCTLTNAEHGYDKTYDFTATTGHIDYSIVGHTHADFTDTFGGVPVIGCANLQNGDIPTFDLVFADYNASKVYLTRIGTGSNREVSI